MRNKALYLKIYKFLVKRFLTSDLTVIFLHSPTGKSDLFISFLLDRLCLSRIIKKDYFKKKNAKKSKEEVTKFHH